VGVEEVGEFMGKPDKAGGGESQSKYLQEGRKPLLPTKKQKAGGTRERRGAGKTEKEILATRRGHEGRRWAGRRRTLRREGSF